MAKKKTVAKKKPAASAKKTTVAKKKPAAPAKKTTSAQKKPAASAKKTTVAKKSAAVVPANIADNGMHEKNIQVLSPHFMDKLKGQIYELMNDFQKMSDNNLTALQRRRKIGAGIRNYGFIDKASDLADANPRFVQFFNIQDFKNAVRNIEMCREIVILLQSFTRMVSNSMMVYSDDAFKMALIFYNMVKEMSRRGDPEAMEIFRALQPFFRRPRRSSAEPTAKEIERDLHAVLHGKADGKIVVEGIAPKKSAGKRVVIDEVRRGRAAIKETAEANIEE